MMRTCEAVSRMSRNQTSLVFTYHLSRSIRSQKKILDNLDILFQEYLLVRVGGIIDLSIYAFTVKQGSSCVPAALWRTAFVLLMLQSQ